MKIVLYGGTFDPWTSAHQEITETLSQKYDKVLVIPTAIRYYKYGSQMFSFDERLQGAREHTAGLKNVKVLDLEKNIDDNWRFLHTLLAVRGLYGAENEYFNAIGSDSLQRFTSWYEWEKILQNSKLVVFNRPGHTQDFPDIPFEYLPMNNEISSTAVREQLRELSQK